MIKREIGLALALTLVAGCSTIHEDNSIGACDTDPSVLMPATPEAGTGDYSVDRDPVILADFQYDRAKSIQDGDNVLFRNQIVGVGRVACQGPDGTIYISEEGSRVRQDYQEAQDHPRG